MKIIDLDNLLEELESDSQNANGPEIDQKASEMDDEATEKKDPNTNMPEIDTKDVYMDGDKTSTDIDLKESDSQNANGPEIDQKDGEMDDEATVDEKDSDEKNPELDNDDVYGEDDKTSEDIDLAEAIINDDIFEYNDLQLMEWLDSYGFDPTIENLTILKEDYLSELFGFAKKDRFQKEADAKARQEIKNAKADYKEAKAGFKAEQKQNKQIARETNKNLKKAIKSGDVEGAGKFAGNSADMRTHQIRTANNLKLAKENIANKKVEIKNRNDAAANMNRDDAKTKLDKFVKLGQEAKARQDHDKAVADKKREDQEKRTNELNKANEMLKHYRERDGEAIRDAKKRVNIHTNDLEKSYESDNGNFNMKHYDRASKNLADAERDLRNTSRDVRSAYKLRQSLKEDIESFIENSYNLLENYELDSDTITILEAINYLKEDGYDVTVETVYDLLEALDEENLDVNAETEANVADDYNETNGTETAKEIEDLIDSNPVTETSEEETDISDAIEQEKNDSVSDLLETLARIRKINESDSQNANGPEIDQKDGEMDDEATKEETDADEKNPDVDNSDVYGEDDKTSEDIDLDEEFENYLFNSSDEELKYDLLEAYELSEAINELDYDEIVELSESLTDEEFEFVDALCETDLFDKANEVASILTESYGADVLFEDVLFETAFKSLLEAEGKTLEQIEADNQAKKDKEVEDAKKKAQEKADKQEKNAPIKKAIAQGAGGAAGSAGVGALAGRAIQGMRRAGGWLGKNSKFTRFVSGTSKIGAKAMPYVAGAGAGLAAAGLTYGAYKTAKAIKNKVDKTRMERRAYVNDDKNKNTMKDSEKYNYFYGKGKEGEKKFNHDMSIYANHNSARHAGKEAWKDAKANGELRGKSRQVRKEYKKEIKNKAKDSFNRAKRLAMETKRYEDNTEKVNKYNEKNNPKPTNTTDNTTTVTEGLTDIQLMEWLDSNGYEPSLENLIMLKEDIENSQNANGPDFTQAAGEMDNEATREEKDSDEKNQELDNKDVYTKYVHDDSDTPEAKNDDVYCDCTHKQVEDIVECVIRAAQLCRENGIPGTLENISEAAKIIFEEEDIRTATADDVAKSEDVEHKSIHAEREEEANTKDDVKPSDILSGNPTSGKDASELTPNDLPQVNESVQYNSLREACLLDEGYFKTDSYLCETSEFKQRKLLEQVALLSAREAGDNAYDELLKTSIYANRLLESIVKKYSASANEKISNIID